ncbi:beta-lactamase family protein [Streptomyces murinus]|uniref:serine hydrolase domain-containing protein n=1 Tax=Streptomyces murinus TaxID=33900 RepID=UPI000A24CDD7|nr:serine hydrolase domain-containing protein [Streptomyces murinus]WDO04572.1 beta-lactamase family protein [Streptomyces murinus]
MAGAVGAAPAGARGSDGGYPAGELRHDPAAVRTAAGGEHHQDGVVRGHGNDGARITVRDLLQQTSGIYDDIDDPEVRDRLLNHFDQNRYDATPPSRLVATAMRHAPLCTPPPHGSPHRWAYSNTNYLLAAMIAEKAGGADWRQLVEHRIIAPLGLRHTYIPGENPYLIGPRERVTIDGPGGVPEDLTEQSYQHTADSAVVTTTCRYPPPANRADTASDCGSSP